MTVKTNPITGKPEEIDRRIDAQQKNEKAMLEGMEVSAALKSDEGTLLVTSIRKHLEARIDVLIKGDEECQAYRKILKGLGYKLAVAQKATEELLKRDLREG